MDTCVVTFVQIVYFDDHSDIWNTDKISANSNPCLYQLRFFLKPVVCNFLPTSFSIYVSIMYANFVAIPVSFKQYDKFQFFCFSTKIYIVR